MVPVVEFVLLHLDVLLTRVSIVYQLSCDLIDHGHTRCLVVHLRFQTLKPGEKD